jgi:CRISPR-associated protein Csa1
MFLLDEDEVRYVLRGLAPQARREGVAEELRGWRWNEAPLAPLYDAALTLDEIADQRCPTGRDIYLRHVVHVEPVAVVSLPPESVARETVTAIVSAAKQQIYEHGPLAPERIRLLPPRLPGATTMQGVALSSLLWEFERQRIAARAEALLARQPAMSADALAATALPFTAGRYLDGRYFGLAAHIPIDAVGFPEPVVFSLRYGERQSWHRLAPAGHALLLEGIHEAPVNVGGVVYLDVVDGQIRIERDLFLIDDELRQAFIDARDERARLVEEEIDPGLPDECPDSCPLLAYCHA